MEWLRQKQFYNLILPFPTLSEKWGINPNCYREQNGSRKFKITWKENLDLCYNSDDDFILNAKFSIFSKLILVISKNKIKHDKRWQFVITFCTREIGDILKAGVNQEMWY